jgi:hypothetical protein
MTEFAFVVSTMDFVMSDGGTDGTGVSFDTLLGLMGNIGDRGNSFNRSVRVICKVYDHVTVERIGWFGMYNFHRGGP